MIDGYFSRKVKTKEQNKNLVKIGVNIMSIRQISLSAISRLHSSELNGARIKSLDSGPGVAKTYGDGGGVVFCHDLIENNASGTENVYSVNELPKDERNFFLYVNGLMQRPDGIDYTFIDGVITFSYIVFTGSNILAVYSI